MRIIFMGTPEFAIPSLKSLHESKHQLLAVVTGPDKPKGRGKKLTPSPVKEFCLEKQLKVLTPVNLKAEDFTSELKNLNPDLMVVVAFRILPQEVFTIPLSYLKGASGYLLVIDGTRSATMETALEIHRHTREVLGSAPFVVLLNKADLTGDWELAEAEMKELEKRGWLYLKSSAKSGMGVEEAFDLLSRRILAA